LKTIIFSIVTISFLNCVPSLAADVEKGQNLFKKKCGTCHQVGPEAKNKVGPTLNNLIDSPVAAVEGYKYGASIVALREAGGVWSNEELSAWLANPKKYLRAKLDNKKAKSKMSFKLKKETERENIIAYLATFSSQAESTDTETAD